MTLPDVCERVLVTEDALNQRVLELGEQIVAGHQGERLILVTVLKGGLFFLADLCRAIDLPLRIDFIAVTPYEYGTGGKVRVTKDLTEDVSDAHVILVEDVVDTGLTVNYVLSLIRAHQPSRLDVCALLDKEARRIADVPIAYRGFTLPDRFVIGYGLDLRGRYRNLPYVASVRDEVIFE